MERVVGIEPTFPAWKAGVLPIYDTRIFFFCFKWSARRDSNPQHPPWQGGALPLSHFRIIGADEGSRTPTPMALDPKSSASANSATSAYYIVGGLPGNRTPDTLIKNQVLYRLS